MAKVKKIFRKRKKEAKGRAERGGNAEAIGLIADRSGGKTTSAVNLLWTFALWGYDVCYIDGDIEIGGKFTDILLESDYFDFESFRSEKDKVTRYLVEGNKDEIDYTLGSILIAKDEDKRKALIDKAIHKFILPDEERFVNYIKHRMNTGKAPKNVIEWATIMLENSMGSKEYYEDLARQLPPDRDVEIRDARNFARMYETRQKLLQSYLNNEMFPKEFCKHSKKRKLGRTGMIFSKNEDMDQVNKKLKDEHAFGKAVDYLSEIKGYDFIIVDTPIGKRDMVSNTLILGLDSWLAPLMLDGSSSVLRMLGLRNHINSLRKQRNLDAMKNLGVFFTRWIEYYDDWESEAKKEYDQQIMEKNTQEYPLLSEVIRENKLIGKNTARGIPTILSLLQYEYQINSAIEYLKSDGYSWQAEKQPINDEIIKGTTWDLFYQFNEGRAWMHPLYEPVGFEKFIDAVQGTVDYAKLAENTINSLKKAGRSIRSEGKIIDRRGGAI